MKLKIKYSRTRFVEIDIEPSATINELMRQIHGHDKETEAYPISLENYSTSILLLFQNQWLEDNKCLSDYDIHEEQIIDFILLPFGTEEILQHHIPEEFVCQLTGCVFYQPMILPNVAIARTIRANALVLQN